MVAFVLRGLWGHCVNTQTSTQTHPAARSHHAVEERGQSVRPLKRLTQPGQRAPDFTVVFLIFFFFFFLAKNSGDKCLSPSHLHTLSV